jgi:hypothetical protein
VSLVTSGTPLRLKRRDLKEQVLHRARELAESGRFEGWQSIEFQLRFFEGFSKTRVWINGPLRKELDAQRTDTVSFGFEEDSGIMMQGGSCGWGCLREL